VLVVPDLRKMVVTDRLTNIFIYDLTGGILPTTPIASLRRAMTCVATVGMRCIVRSKTRVEAAVSSVSEAKR
jgi:hypothetical protein